MAVEEGSIETANGDQAEMQAIRLGMVGDRRAERQREILFSADEGWEEAPQSTVPSGFAHIPGRHLMLWRRRSPEHDRRDAERSEKVREVWARRRSAQASETTN